MTPFHVNDRAYAMDATGTALVARQLYCVRAVYMDRTGGQQINLVGHGDDFYNASRFVRIADPCPRAWPTP